MMAYPSVLNARACSASSRLRNVAASVVGGARCAENVEHLHASRIDRIEADVGAVGALRDLIEADLIVHAGGNRPLAFARRNGPLAARESIGRAPSRANARRRRRSATALGARRLS